MIASNSTNEVLTTLRQIIRAIDLQSKKLVKKYGLTLPQLILLKEIKENPEQPISKISKQVSLSQATVTSILDRLEKQGFAVRERGKEDKRKVYTYITEKAETILSIKPQLLQESFSREFEKLEEWEKNMILSALQRLTFLMNADDIESQPMLASGPLEASPAEVNSFLEDEYSN